MKPSLMLCLWLLLASMFSTAHARPPVHFKALLYSSPDRYHNQALPTAVNAFKQLAEKNFFDLTWTQLPTDLNAENLKQFNVVIFLFSNGRELKTEQVEALKTFVHGGGGFVGIHASSVDSGQDIWLKKLVGRSFRGHPEKQTGLLEIADRRFPATMHLPEHWLWTDEWYEFGEALTPGLHVVLRVNESSYEPIEHKQPDGSIVYGMGGDHPIAWYQEFEGGRSFYTALGHLEIFYNDPLFLMHLYGGIYWAATGKGIANEK